jgi:hypothetical protein
MLRLDARLALVVALAAQVLLGIATAHVAVPPAPRVLVVVASDVLVGWFVISNLPGRPRAVGAGLAMFGAGWLLNLLPIAVNGAMPVSAGALTAAGLTGRGASRIDVSRGHLGKHVLSLGWHAHGARGVVSSLGDTIPVRLFGAVVSPGDVVMAAGLVIVVAAAMHVRDGPREPTSGSVVRRPSASRGTMSDASASGPAHRH